MAGEGEEVDVLESSGEVWSTKGDARSTKIEGKLGGGLDGVGVEAYGGVVGPGDAGELADGLDGSGFVVGEHDGDELGLGTECGTEGVGIDQTVGCGREIGDVDAAAMQGLGGVEDGVVLDFGGDEVSWLALVDEGLEDAGEGEVVALGAAGGEDDLLGGAVEEAGDGGTGVLDGGAGALAGLVRGAGVAEGLDPEGTHGVDDLGEERGGGVGVEVDAVHELIVMFRWGPPPLPPRYFFYPKYCIQDG